MKRERNGGNKTRGREEYMSVRQENGGGGIIPFYNIRRRGLALTKGKEKKMNFIHRKTSIKYANYPEIPHVFALALSLFSQIPQNWRFTTRIIHRQTFILIDQPPLSHDETTQYINY